MNSALHLLGDGDQVLGGVQSADQLPQLVRHPGGVELFTYLGQCGLARGRLVAVEAATAAV